MALNVRLRWAIGLLGLLLIAVAVALAWRVTDGLTVVGFLGAGIVLLVLAGMPGLPTRIGIAGGSLEYPEQLTDWEYIATLTAALEQLMNELAARRAEEYWRTHPDEIPGASTGGGITAFEADIDSARRLARDARTPADLKLAMSVARQAAQERVTALRWLIEDRPGAG